MYLQHLSIEAELLDYKYACCSILFLFTNRLNIILY